MTQRSRPLYQEIADELLGEIRSGKVPVGQMMPTEMEVRDRFGVSRHTIREAIRQLLATLTPRETDVFHYLLTGLLNKQIGGELGIAEKTVKIHRAQVMAKLGVHSVAELVHMEHQVGIDPPAV